MMVESKQVRIHADTWSKLMNMGIYGESMDDIINRLIAKYPDEVKKKREVRA